MKRSLPNEDPSNELRRVRPALTVGEVLERAASRTERARGSAVEIVDATRRERERELTRRIRA
jgi:hypothetical protein